MILDLGTVSNLIQVTAQYSNAVMVAVLPYFSDVAKKLDLPVPQPITQADVAKVHFLPFLATASRDTSVSIMLKDGWAFTYQFGYVHLIANAHGYPSLQDPDQISRYYGEVKMSPDEAVQFARGALKKLGVPLEDVFAEQEPQITLPVKIGTNTVPHYEIKWLNPQGGDSVDIHLNGNTKQFERIYLLNKNLKHPLKTDVVPPPALSWRTPVNPEYASRLIPMMFRAIEDYAQKLSLPVPRSLTTNNVAKVTIDDNGGWPHCEIELTNGWRFIYRHAMINGHYAPDNFCNSDQRPIHVKEFEGKWNLTTNQAIELVKKTLAKLNYPTNNIHMDFAPHIIFPAGDFRKIIPYYFFEWDYENAAHDDLQSKVEAEVNADNGKLESLYYDDKTYWNNRPAIDVPISINRSPTNPP